MSLQDFLMQLDTGVIALKNKKLIPISENVYQGAAGYFRIPELDNLTFSIDAAGTKISNNAHEMKVVRDFSYIQQANEKVLYWNFRGIQFKTKVIGHSIYLTKFNLDDDHYQVLQGFDVSLYKFYRKQTKKLVKRFLSQSN